MAVSCCFHHHSSRTVLITITTTEMSTPPTMQDVYDGSGVSPSLPNPDKPTHEGEFHNDLHTSPVPITRATKIYALCAAVNSCNLGYDIGVNTNAGWRVQQDFNLSDTVRTSSE